MAVRKWQQSIVGRVSATSRQITVLLIIPVFLSLILMLAFSGDYRRTVSRMGTIAAMKPVINEEIPDAVWRVVSGRETMDDSRVYEMLDEIDASLLSVTQRSSGDDSLELIIAGRTMDTLRQYVDRIRDNLDEGASVVTNESVLSEIRDVAALVVSMLNDYITSEINASASMGDRLNRIVLIAAAAELFMALLATITAGRTARATAKFIREPIEKLEGVTSRLADGDMSARLPMTNVRELWTLTGRVNVMADKLDEMMRQRVRDERNLKKAELRTLQAQINPHFLYNTLDAIVWKAEAGDQKEVIHLTRALSDFFRISLSSGADWIPISQEKKHIAGYLSIQKTRYRDILNYEIDIPDEIGKCYILKLLLQPLVENALYHGIKYKRGGGTIYVGAAREGTLLTFTVRDTGAGMDEATLTELRRKIDSRQSVRKPGDRGFGLVNVNLRLRLYYNLPDGLYIESGPGGTTVRFRVPYLTAEDTENDESLSG